MAKFILVIYFKSVGIYIFQIFYKLHSKLQLHDVVLIIEYSAHTADFFTPFVSRWGQCPPPLAYQTNEGGGGSATKKFK